jgi:hypothetical protein
MDQDPTSETRKRVCRYVVQPLRIILGCIILVALTRWSGPREVLTRIGTFPVAIALACVCIALLVQYVGAVRLAFLARSQGLLLKTAEALEISLAAVFYGLFLPGGNATGWAVRLLRMSGSASNVGIALVVLAGNRALVTATLAGIGAMTDFLRHNARRL